MARVPGLRDPKSFGVPGMIGLQTGILSPCIGCKNAYAALKDEFVAGSLGNSPLCPRKALDANNPDSEFVVPKDIVGLPINPIFNGSILYAWVALHAKNNLIGNREMDTEKIVCEPKPYILFLPEAYYNTTGMVQQGEDVVLMDQKLIFEDITYGGAILSAQFRKKFPGIKRGVDGITTGGSGK